MKDKTNNYNNLRWVILLLAIAVILPTVCLLWFMTQAVKNERLAVRQKLVDTYKQQLEQIIQECNRSYERLADSFVNEIQRKEPNKPPVLFPRNFSTMSAPGSIDYALIVYDANGQVEFPKFEKTTIETELESEALSAIWKVEFVKNDYEAAAKLYGEVAESTQDNIVKYKAIVSKARCLAKKEQYSEAIETCKYLFNSFPATSMERNAFVLPPVIVINNNIRLIELYIKTNQDYDDLTDGLLTAIGNSHWPLSIREFGLEQLETFTENGETIKNKSRKAQYQQVHREIKVESQALSVAEKYPNILLFGKWRPTTIQRIKMPEPTYVFFFEDSDHKYVLSGAPDILFSFTHPFEKTFLCRIIDNLGNTYKLVDFPSEYHFIGLEQASQILKNENADTKPMLTVSMGKYFPGWVFELYPKNGDIFENAASKQTAIYTWTGVLVVLLILSSGAVSGQVISRQIKLNRLKNDFIATITHELKTPLSSMRVLVDTLLDGRCQSKQQETEYLELISKENIRLSRLIDNFLTFSRMERNKQAFDMAKTNPAEIAKAAAEAVQTKFNHENRKLTVTIGDDLPSISADKDTMVTVLVNLLDNAYKYSYDNKQIEMRVFSEESYVCFAVKDNGIGMTKRQIKRIFDRFYQVDTSLTRRAEGSGLGLSIVKFIVDAHKGRIDVESTVGKGSEFIVKIPIYGNSFNNRR